MNIIRMAAGAALTACLLLSYPAGAQTPGAESVFTGNVTRISGNMITIRTTGGASYTAETSRASLVRKNGSVMGFSEVLIGDRVEVRGRLWADNSMNASLVRNLSLYVHSGTFNGKITEIFPQSSSFTLQGRTYGIQTIVTDSLTSYKRNGAGGTFGSLELGMSATVKGAWERTRERVSARQVDAVLRLVNIEITGRLVMKGESSMTVIGDNNVIYGVDTAKAKFTDKKGKTFTAGRFSMGDTVKVQGKHVSESVQITAATVKDLSALR